MMSSRSDATAHKPKSIAAKFVSALLSKASAIAIAPRTIKKYVCALTYGNARVNRP